MIIRVSTESDRSYIKTVVQKLFTYHSNIDPFYCPITDESVLDDFLSKQDIMFVAVDESETMLGAIVGQYHKDPADRRVSYASLRTIWVEESARGQGVAHALVSAFEVEAKAKGARLVDLHFDVRNDLARDLWKGEGYELYQERCKKEL